MNDVKTVPAKRSVSRLIAAWLIVSVPAAWGISQTIHRSLALFNSTQPAPVAPAATPGPSSSD
jgi:hypothetical protein